MRRQHWSRSPGLLGAAVVLCLAAAGVQAGAPVTRCDRIAANPDDLDRVTPGVYWTVLDGRAARSACGEALERYGDEPRLIYQFGRALARLDRFDEAVPYLSRAAEEGHLIAFTTLGSIYQEVTRNYAEAASWYRQGAELGSASAQVHLGDMYLFGEGFEADARRATNWYRKAAVQGYALGQSKLATLYEEGRGVARDLDQAADWYRKAAAEGLPRAQFALGRMNLLGAGRAADPTEAALWLRKAADQGYGPAILELARIHRSGTGVARDLREAYYWYVIASRHREARVRDAAESNMREMCRNQRAAAGEPTTVAWCCIE